MKASRARTARMLGLAVTALATSACAAISPTPIATPYDAGDGVSATITDPNTHAVVKLQNFLIVASAKDAPGALLGAVVNGGDSATVVNVAVNGSIDAPSTGTALVTGQIDAPAGALTKVGPSDVAITVPNMPSAPGTLVTVTASTPTGGSVTLQVPVLAPTQQYSSSTPSLAPSATATTAAAGASTSPSAKATKRPSASASASATK